MDPKKKARAQKLTWATTTSTAAGPLTEPSPTLLRPTTRPSPEPTLHLQPPTTCPAPEYYTPSHQHPTACPSPETAATTTTQLVSCPPPSVALPVRRILRFGLLLDQPTDSMRVTVLRGSGGPSSLTGKETHQEPPSCGYHSGNIISLPPPLPSSGNETACKPSNLQLCTCYSESLVLKHDAFAAPAPVLVTPHLDIPLKEKYTKGERSRATGRCEGTHQDSRPCCDGSLPPPLLPPDDEACKDPRSAVFAWCSGNPVSADFYRQSEIELHAPRLESDTYSSTGSCSGASDDDDDDGGGGRDGGGLRA